MIRVPKFHESFYGNFTFTFIFSKITVDFQYITKSHKSLDFLRLLLANLLAEIRHISYEAREIEAESVAWFVCSHLGIVTKSETYICHLLKDNDSIPDDLDVNTIYKAANQVLEFATRINYKDTLLYHYDPNYKKLVKD